MNQRIKNLVKDAKLVLFSFAVLSSASIAKSNGETEHAHVASPDRYTVLLENNEVLVLKMVLMPGEQDRWHKHNAETVYFEQGGTAVITTKEGSNRLDIPDGFTMWHDAWEHQVSNVGKTAIKAIIVERK